MIRASLVWASILGASGVAIGAFGAHGLEGFLIDSVGDAPLIARRIAQFETGARYHLVHAVALLAIGGSSLPPGRVLSIAVRLFVAGTLFFSGSLYLLVLTNTPWLGAITPIGGLCWIAAWSLLGFAKRVQAA